MVCVIFGITIIALLPLAIVGALSIYISRLIWQDLQ